MQLFKFCGKRKKLEEGAEHGKEPRRDGFHGSSRKTRSELLDIVQFAAANALGCQRSEIGTDTVLATLGLDSAAAVRFIDLLQSQLEIGRRLPATLVFDYPSVCELVDRGLPRCLSNDVAHAEPMSQVPKTSEILISSCAWDLPGADDLNVLWTRLEHQIDEVQEIPLCRWDWTETTADLFGVRHGSFLENADQFDAHFFSLSAAETQVMDPQQRLLLTTSYGALAGSGHDKATLQGSPMSIFVALSNQDWYHRSLNAATSAYTGTGVSAAVAANRISFTLGLRGPSATLDTACSSSLTAISAASDSLQRPSRLQGPSCRRKLREAVAAGCELLLGPNSILLRATASMLSPTGRCQTFNATADGYVRGEGSGAMLLTSGDSKADWCGSEVMLCAATTNQDGRSATLTAPNGQAQEDVLLDALWLSSLGASAVNFVECHGTGTALGDPIEARALDAVLGHGGQDAPLWLSAGKTVHGHLEAAAGFAGLAEVMCSLQHDAMTPNLHFNELNPHIDLNHSSLAVPTAVSQLRRQEGSSLVSGLSSFGFGGTNAHALLRGKSTGSQATARSSRKVAMLFSGQGEIRPGTGKELYAADATFRSELDRCAQLCSSHLERGLLDVILSDDDSNRGLLSSSAQYSFVANFCLQHAMVEMWKARGVEPVAVLGHSLGDFAAATAAGVLSLQDGLRLVATRGRLLDELCQAPAGRMAAIFAPLKEVQAALGKYKDLTVAAINSPNQTVVSGPKEQIEDLCERFSGKSKLLKSLFAMHSKLVSPVLPGMQEELKTCKFRPPSVTFVSCMAASILKEEVTHADYWLSHDMAKPVDFFGAVKVLEKLGDSFLEIGPSPVLAKLARTFSQVPLSLESLEPHRHETEVLLSVSRAIQVVASSKRPARAVQSVPWVKPLLHPLLGAAKDAATFSKTLSFSDPKSGLPPALRLFHQHRVQGASVLPAASHILLMAAALAEAGPVTAARQPDINRFIALKDVSFEQMLPCSELPLHIEVQIAEEDIELRGRSSTVARAKHGGLGASPAAQQSLVEWQGRCCREMPEIYRTLEEFELQYGPSFATILSCSFSDDKRSAVARLSLAAEVEAWERSLQLLHPGILDGAFQLMILAHRAIFGTKKGLCLLPFSVDNCVLKASHVPQGEHWATLHITSSSHDSIAGHVEIALSGALVARLSGISLRQLGPTPEVTSQEVTYDLTWQPATGGAVSPVAPSSVLLCGAASHEPRLRAAVCGDRGEIDSCSLSQVEERLRMKSYDVLVYLASGDALDSLVEALTLLQVVQRCQRPGGRFSLVLATEGTQQPEVEQHSFHPCHAGLWGLARSARLECDFPVRLLDLDSGDGQLPKEVLSEEEEVCLRRSSTLVPRLKLSDIKPAWALQLHLDRGGGSMGQALSTVPQHRDVREGTALLRVAAVGLNFRDVLNVMGLYPGDPGDPGLDCSGLVVEPAAFRPWRLGEEVFGISFGCLRTFAPIKEPRLLVKRPKHWTHLDAAALPTVWTTVEVALHDLADLKAGQRLLVHAGAGGVGLTAVQYALRLGALVYATASHQEKKDHLLRMGVQFVASSRDGALFEEELGRHLNGEKIDVVLNSLSHDNFIGRSLNFLGEGGSFVEIGKRGIWTEQQMQEHRPDVHYKVLAMDTLCEEEPDRFNFLLDRLSQRMETAEWLPLQREVFEGLVRCSEALQVLRKAEKIGKIVVSVPLLADGPTTETGAYALTGGTGALGLFVARRLVEEGAKDLILISRSGQSADLGQLKNSAAQVQVLQCDLASPSAVDVLTTSAAGLAGCRGVLHLAGELSDGVLHSLQRSDFEVTFGPKVWALQALRQALGRCQQWENLDFILSFSSTASILGAAGQGNYAAANACMDAWMYKYRLESSVSAVTLNWGAWLDIGMAAEQPSRFRQNLSQKGISPELGMAVIGSVLDHRASIRSLGCAHVDWKSFLSKYVAGPPKIFSDLSTSIPKDEHQRVSGSPDLVSQSSLPWVLSVASEVIGDLELDEPLTSAGMDSLSAVELRRKLCTSGVSLPSTVAFDHPTVRALAQHLDQKHSPAPATAPSMAPATGSSAVVAGKACRVPGGNSTCTTTSQAWHMIFQQQLDAVTEIPLLRFDVNECFDATASGVGFLTYARHASAIDGVDLFDNRFFGISSNEAAAIDPQQRHHLEVAYAACHDAGRPRKVLSKTNIGVFVGQCANDWAKTSKDRKAGTFMGPGTHASISANRISFCLGLEGVSVTVDTACSSTLVALDLSLQRLQSLDAVLCCGGQLNLTAEPFVSFSNGRLLSQTGRCRTFDSSADGFARGEGFGSFLLVQDSIEAIGVAGSMANQDGRSSSLTAPNGPAQQRAITGALKLAGANATEIAAVECHGTGTALGDPIEVGALGASLAREGHPLLLMAGKTNVGHLEGAAGALGLVKCIMALENQEAPPNVHLAELNPHLDLKDFLVVPSSSHALSSKKVGLSSFGFGGTNAHAILAAPHSGGPRPSVESLPELTFKAVAFPWTWPVPRLLRLHRVPSGKETLFEVRIDEELLEFNRKVHGKRVMSSSLLMALAMDGCRRHLKQAASAVQLKSMKMTAPLILPADYDGHTWLRLSINEQQFEVASRHRFSQKAWLVHCVGRFSTQVAPVRPSAFGSLSLLGGAPGGVRRPAAPRGPTAESFEALCRSSTAIDDGALEDLRKKALDEGLCLSDSVVLSDIHVGKGEMCARVKIPGDFVQYTAHPQLLDLLHFAALCLAFFGEAAKSLVQELTSVTSLSVPTQEIPKGTENFVLHCRERRYGIHPQSISCSSTLSVDGGPVVLDVQEMHLRPVRESQVAAVYSSTGLEVPSLYEMQWLPASSSRTFQEEGGSWLLLCPRDPKLAADLGESIEKDQARESKNDSDSDKDEANDPAAEEKSSVGSESGVSRRSQDSARLAATCRDSLPDDEERLGAFLEGFDKIFVVASGGSSSRAVEVIAAAVQVMKAQLARPKAAEIWFVLEGTQAAQLEDLAKSSIPYHAGLWGLARCARREHREQFVGCIEVGCSSGCTAPAALWRRLRSASAKQEDGREHELSVRRSALGGEESGSDDDDVERHMARLEQTTVKAYGVWPPPIFPSHSWFAISGGLGGLGIATASWMMTQGVTHVALLSRSGRCQQDGQAAKDLQHLCSCDVQVLMHACDISSRDAVQEAAEAMNALGPVSVPVKGVVHAAGLLQDHLIAHMQHSHLQPVLAPKMDGAVNLHETFSDLSHFILFSSVAALLGSPGQGNYAAANSFLDCFALHRQAKGLPALSLQWGPWAEVGMAARSGVGGPGFWAPKIHAADALQALGSVLAASTKTSPSVIGITQVNWSVLLKRVPSMPPTWSNFKDYWEPPAGEPTTTGAMREEPLKSSPVTLGGDATRALRTGLGMSAIGNIGAMTRGLNMSFASSGLSRPRNVPGAGKKDPEEDSESPSESDSEDHEQPALASKGL